MAKVIKVKYFTKERKNKINEDNIKLYDKYLKSNIIKNKDVKDTTFKTYSNYFTQFLVYLSEEWENVGLYDEKYIEDAVDIMEGFIAFCQDTLKNNKKVINTKLSAVSSFYLWSLKRGLIDRHPFDKKLDRMKGANEEKIINSYFLNDDEVRQVRVGLLNDQKYDLQDRIIWELMIDSANRIGAISKLTLSSMDLENMIFSNIREKRGYLVEVVFSENTKELIQEWLDVRKEMDNLEVDSLFITKYKGEHDSGCKPMEYGTIQRRIQKIGRIIGLDDFHAHCIRKTTLSNIAENASLELAAELGNHKSTETTRSAYVRPKSKTEVRDKIRKMMGDKKNTND